ncbi:MAG: riboflavin synthase [Chitinophagaceae bacterium]|nr:riboflavin synthase [Chitinophagaceae bacterium]
MFTGIIEDIGTIKSITPNGSNLTFQIATQLNNVEIDDSVACNGICLTVEAKDDETLTFTAINETIEKTNAAYWKNGTLINMERTLPFNGRIDGHLVQGHVDGTGLCVNVQTEDGSHIFTFSYDEKFSPLLIEKGSVCVNGVSLTVINLTESSFSVAIIPYTFEHTNFKNMKLNRHVNLEFDMIGKYIRRFLDLKEQ